jgi:L,D-peptidoglycan transpeptidase YkuD (ErfK/YbiS/YcfS/YnhG family)
LADALFQTPAGGPPRRPCSGGAIFLHVNGDDDTAGCVSVSPRRMRKLLRWFEPDREPRIVMGPKDEIENL